MVVFVAGVRALTSFAMYDCVGGESMLSAFSGCLAVGEWFVKIYKNYK